MNDFTKRYKKLSTSKLLKIVQNPENYQAAAIEAAQIELAKRGLEEGEIEAAQDIIQSEKNSHLARQVKVQQVENKRKALIESWNTIKYQKPSLNFQFYAIGIFFTLSIIGSLILNYDYYEYLFLMEEGGLDFSIVLTILTNLLLLIACYFFWKRKAIGWILFTFQTAFMLPHNISESINAITYTPSDYELIDLIMEELNNTSSGMAILKTIITMLILWTLCHKDFAKMFSVQKKEIYITLSVAIFLGVFLLAI